MVADKDVPGLEKVWEKLLENPEAFIAKGLENLVYVLLIFLGAYALVSERRLE